MTDTTPLLNGLRALLDYYLQLHLPGSLQSLWLLFPALSFLALLIFTKVSPHSPLCLEHASSRCSPHPDLVPLPLRHDQEERLVTAIIPKA